MTGGASSTGSYLSGVWTYDLTQLAQPGNPFPASAWLNIVPDSGANASFPAGRSGHSLVAYEASLVLFGGRGSSGLLNDVWVSVPNVPPSPYPWTLISPVDGVVPPARYGHAAGLVNGETMVIFGGTGAAGALGDLWSYDISLRTWKRLSPMGVGPTAMSAPLGGTVGRHFVLYNASLPNSVFVYYPPDPNFVLPTPIPVDCHALGGVNAAIVITVLVSTATLVFGVWKWRLLRGSGSSPHADAYAGISDGL